MLGNQVLSSIWASVLYSRVLVVVFEVITYKVHNQDLLRLNSNQLC